MNSLFRLNRRIWPYVTSLIVAFITYLSLAPLPELPMPDMRMIDKIWHLIAYAAAAFPLVLATPARWPYWLAAVLAWSGVVELIQPLVNRHNEWADLGANGLGLVLGATIAMAVRWLVSAD